MRFRLTHEGRDLVDAAPCSDAKSRVAHVLHVDEKHLLAVGTGLGLSLRVDLILGDINIKRARRDMQFIFVNGRPVQNKAISFHLNQVYRLIMPKDLYPLFVVSLHLPAKEIDVNIHPTKREVKIRDEQKSVRSCGGCARRRFGNGTNASSDQRPGARDREDVVERALMGAHPSEVTFDSAPGTEILRRPKAEIMLTLR